MMKKFQEIYCICAGSLYAVFLERIGICGRKTPTGYSIMLMAAVLTISGNENRRIQKRRRPTVARNAGKHHKRKI